jgi:hypothetical protein
MAFSESDGVKAFIIIYLFLIQIFQLSRYREGGYESGFRSIADLVHTPRLLHVKGKRNVRIKQV